MRFTSALAVVLIATVTARADDHAAAVVDWVKSKAIPLTTVQAGQGFADMQPIKSIVGDARVVSLGESTHGTREHFQMKHRMLEFLVSEMGFTAFGIEASLPDCIAINDFVMHGKGDPEKAVAGQGFWTWSTEEVLDLVKWMRRYNEDPAHQRKIRFYGFDMQNESSAANAVLIYLAKVDPPAAEKFKPLFKPAMENRFMMGGGKDEDLKSVREAAKEAAAHMDDNRDAYVNKTGRDEFAIHRRCADVLDQAVELAESIRSGGRDMNRENVRDKYMAANVAWILEHEGEGSKVVAWAHNGHVMMEDSDDGRPFWPQGEYMERQFGDDHVVFGFAFNEGSFQAIPAPSMPAERRGGLQEWTVKAAKEGSADAVLAAAGIDNFVLDLRSASADGPVRQWLDSPQPMRMAGAVFDPDNEDRMYYRPLRLGKAFDALIFTGKTTRAVPLATLSYSSMMPGSAVPPKVRLGVQMQQKGEEEADQPGVKILALMPGHAAEAAGLRAGDRILKIGDDEINALPDVYPALRKYEVDQVARVTVVRDGQEQVIDVKMIKPRTTAAARPAATTKPS